ncbi:GntR family transcriptional regulator [Acrocarpospora pleiomorpha]|uniref:GntR family transcriptional regulator n=2 Tax=Acrocarpospora pleiomorpha TaxID=90975 RepID=A0A5M3XJ54_9ACTN|nr:GntR family transcriptional regulator [Acrocarpospora pleiomorpha]
MSGGAGDRESLGALAPRESLREASRRTLHAAVISGYLKPGTVYSARALGTQLGISATPVREAMLDLVKEGLVEAVPNKGFRVVQLTERELDELTELRQLIEVPTVRLIAERGISDPVGMMELSELADELIRTARDKDFIGHHVADLQFHLKLLAFAGNENLVATVHNLRIRSRLYGIPKLADRGRLVATAREHFELLDLIRARDADAAEKLMRRHIGHVRGAWATGEDATSPSD